MEVRAICSVLVHAQFVAIRALAKEHPYTLIVVGAGETGLS
jgi:hypothetical protein